MKKIFAPFLISLLIFPVLTLASCSTRSSVNEQCASNCEAAGGSYNSSDCSCSCPTGYYSPSDSSCSCVSNSYKGSEAEEDVFGDDTDSGGSSSGGSSSDSSTGGTVSSGSGVGISNPIDADSFQELVDMVVDWILDIAMVLAPLILVYGGFTYITAAGDTSKVTQAKKIILYAAIGFLLALLAKSLIGILKDLVV